MRNSEFVEAITKEARKTRKQLKSLHLESGDFENPVDTDMVKTTKAMFYERVIEIIRKQQQEEK